MDPFSITASIVTLIQVSAQVTILVKQFRDEVNVVDATLNGILNDVDGFQQVLQSMRETFAQEDIQADVLATGHVGSHWKNLARSLSDGETTLDQLRSLLSSVNKSTSFLDASRKQLRLKSAIAQISGFREQIQSYRAALQLSLSTIMVWNQVTLRKSAANIPDRIMPNLNKLYDQIRTLGADLNAKIGKLESTVANQGFHAEMELISMSNLKECVESAADVVSTASTTLGPEGTERASVRYGSDFGDVFRKDANEPMQRWMSSHTVYEYDDAEAPTLDPSEASTGDAPTMYESDSDSDIEHELVRALFSNGKKRKDQGDLQGAERHLKNCLSRFPSTASYATLASSQSTLATGVSKAELLELLTETYCLQGNWTQAKSTMKEKLAITERQAGKKSEYFLWDSFRLCEVLLNTKDYTEAQLHGRQALRGFRKLRGDGHTGYEKTLALLVQVCNEQDNPEDEEAYAALLSSHQVAHKISLPGGALVSKMNETQGSSVSKPTEHTFMPQEVAKDEVILESEGSTPNLSKSADTGKQTQLRELTPIPPIMTRSDSTTLSPSSSISAGPWSPPVQAARFRGTSPLPNDIPGEVAAAVPHTKNTEHAPKGVSAKQATVMTTNDANNEAVASSTKLLVDLCQQELGHKPIFMIGCGREGHNCIVFADETRDKIIAKAVDCRTKDEARYVAATKAYKALVSTSLSSPITTARSSHTGGANPREGYTSRPSSAHQIPTRSDQVDPPPYMEPKVPSSLNCPTGFLQDVPEILLSPVISDAAIAVLPPSNAAQNILLRRAVSDSRLPQQKISTVAHTAAPISLGEAYSKGSNNDLSAHRRAASTSSRFPGARAGASTASQQSFGLAITTPALEETHILGSTVKDSKLQPSVTFDTIESFVERPDHSNPDPTTPTSRNFSLFPSSLAKTFSLQDRRSKSNDLNLAKKKSLRFGLSSRRKPSTSGLAERQTSSDTGVTKPPCPICSTSLQGLNDDETWSHVDNCLGRPSPSANDFAFELPASEPSSYAVELPASIPATDLPGLSDLHRAFSRRDLSADKFETETGARLTSAPPRSTLRVLQRQVLLLGDPECGKTWLSSAWCDGTVPKHTHPVTMTFSKHMGHCETVIRDYSGIIHASEKLRRASYGDVHTVLLCFDISSPDSFENIEHKWNHEADLYLKDVPKILVGCKKDISHTATQTVWTRDAYKLTAKINARAYFETSAVTMEGLDALFNHVAQITRR